MDYNILITFLQEKQYLTDLEKDILDTWNAVSYTHLTLPTIYSV